MSVIRRDNEACLTTDADRSSFFIALVVVDIFAGLADAISGPYLVLFLVDRADREGVKRHRVQRGVWRLDRQAN